MSKNDQNTSKFKYLVHFSQEISIIDSVHSVIMFRYGLAIIHPVAAIGGLQRTQNGQKRPQNDPFYAILKKKSRIMNFFLSNLLVPKNVASVKCKRVETAKKYSPEHRISLSKGLK